jgi:hypothetical protein
VNLILQMKAHYFILILALFFPYSVYSQEDTLTDPDQVPMMLTEPAGSDQKSSFKNKFDTDLEIGTSFTYSPANFYGPYYYAAPSLTYSLTPRLYVTAGAGIQYSTFYSLNSNNEGTNKMLPMTQAFLFASGTYLLSPRLAISGTVYKSALDATQLSKNSRALNYNYQGMSVGFNYKITDSFSFGIQMNIQNGSYRSDEFIPNAGYAPVTGF